MKGLKKISTRIYIGILTVTVIVISFSTLIDYLYSRNILAGLVKTSAEHSFSSAYRELDSEILPIINSAHNSAFFLANFGVTQDQEYEILSEPVNYFPSVFGSAYVKVIKQNNEISGLRFFEDGSVHNVKDNLICDTLMLNGNKQLKGDFPFNLDLKNDTVIFSYYLWGEDVNICIQYQAHLQFFVDVLNEQIGVSGSDYYLFDRYNNPIQSSTEPYNNTTEEDRKQDIEILSDYLKSGTDGLITPAESGYEKAIYIFNLRGTSFNLATVFPLDDIVERFRRYFAISFGITIILFGLLAYVLQRVIIRNTRSITELTDLSKKIEEGGLNIPIPENYKDGETVQLSNALRTVQDRMKRYVSNLNSTLKEKRALEHELQVASRIQAEMQPKPLRALKDIPDIDIYARMVPAKGVAGDFYEYFFLDKENLFFVLGDVSGKGIPAAMFMARTITLIQVESQKEYSPGKVFSKVNNYLTDKNDEGMFVTAVGGVVNIVTGELTLCDAGHNTPLFSFDSNDYDYKELEKNMPLGILPGREYKETRLKLNISDSLILYSDGLTEAQSKAGKLLGDDAVKDTLTGKGKSDIDILANLLWNLLDSFTINAPQSDDITLLILRYFGKSE